MPRGLSYKNALFCWRQGAGYSYGMLEMHRNARLLHKHHFQSQYVSPQQCCVMKLACGFVFFFSSEKVMFWRSTTVVLGVGCLKSWDQDKGKRKPHFWSRAEETTAVKKSSHFLSHFSRQSSFQGIQGSILLAIWLFYSSACPSSSVNIFHMYPMNSILIAPWRENKAHFPTADTSWSIQGLLTF